ncbi:MAG TPA: sulfotransferase [Stellaceae bacterium]
MPLATAPFFIVGSGRSGTTLLRMILASHSRLTIPPETWFMLPLLRRLEPTALLTPADVEFTVETITGHYRWPDMRLPTAEFRRRIEQFERPALRDIVEVIYREHARRDNKPRWGDKTPGYIEIVPQLVQMFPGSRFIHLCRDGRDVAKSFQQQGWYGPWLHANFFEWNEAWDYRERWNGTVFAQNILDVRYEELTLETEQTVQRICAFLDEKFEPQMLAWQSRVEDLIPAREVPIHDKLRRAPVAADVGRWRREMTVREQFVSEAFIGPRLRRAGYERRFESPFWRPVFAAVRWYCAALASVADAASKVLGFLRRRRLDRAADGLGAARGR